MCLGMLLVMQVGCGQGLMEEEEATINVASWACTVPSRATRVCGLFVFVFFVS